MNEEQLTRAITDYISLQYPKVIYRFDLGGVRLPIGLAVKCKAINKTRAYPDLFIAEPRGVFHGLFVEIKPEGTRIYKKISLPATPHIEEQETCIFKLNDREYAATFGVGFDDCKAIIDDYLK